MIHRRFMYQLVADAKDGDNEAFRHAIHIDRTVMQLPYFQQRILEAQFSNDEDFLEKVATSTRTCIAKSRIKYRTLTLTFYMLDKLRMLDLPREVLIKICDRIGVTNVEQGVTDVESFYTQLKTYKTMSRK